MSTLTWVNDPRLEFPGRNPIDQIINRVGLPIEELELFVMPPLRCFVSP